jgi:4-hydroxy-tetrahydrodipicolinate reductase
MLAAAGLHRPWVFEAHHTGKKDAPSGTARRLAELVMEADPRMRSVVEGNPSQRLAEDALQVVSLRSGSETGTHTVGFDGDYDRITLSHRARDRAAFAVGAVLAAEWLVGKQGLHRFEDVVDELVARSNG